MMWPPPQIVDPTPPPAKAAAAAAKMEAAEPNYFNMYMKDSMMYTAGLGTLIGLGCASPYPAFTTMVTTFGLAGIVGESWSHC